MPMLAFLPWATVSKPMRFGSFHIVSCSAALATGAIPADLRGAVDTILEGYGHKRPVDRAQVPLLRRDDLEFAAELDDSQIAAYYDFRTRLTFAALAERHYFYDLRYCCSDSVRLDIRSFTPQSTGAVVVQRRRRDGFQRIIYSTGTYHERKPDYVGWCDLCRHADVPLLDALEQCAARGDELWGRLADAIAVFVRANSDSPAVDPQSELIDTVSAFSRLVDASKEPRVVGRFLSLLPAPREKKGATGPKVRGDRVRQALQGGRSLRDVWLEDAFNLRHQFGHGRALAPGYSASWTLHEHLLLSAWIFPVAVKALLANEGLYTFTPEDRFRDRVFEELLEIDPYASLPAPEPGEDPVPAWRAVMSDMRMRFAGEEIERLWAQQECGRQELQRPV